MSYRKNSVVLGGLLLSGLLLAQLDSLRAQKSTSPKKKVVTATSPPEKSDEDEPVVIERETLRLIDPKGFQIPLQLEPIRALTLTSLVDGAVRIVNVDSGDKINAQAEAVQIDSREHQFLLDRAKANHRLAQIELKRTKKQTDAELVEMAEAKLQAAEADLGLANFRIQRNSLRAAFASQVFRVHVVAGQYVRAGEPLVELGDTSKLKLEIPVDRALTGPGKSIEVRIEDTTTTARIEKILPLAPRFEPLRRVVNSLASAIIVIDNPQDRYHVGQAVFIQLIPRNMLAEVPTRSLANLSEGRRKLQVVRKNLIRDIEVQLHAQVGTDRIFVSGPFTQGDEVIVATSQDLPDGTFIRLRSVVKAQSKSGSEVRGSKRPTRGAF